MSNKKRSERREQTLEDYLDLSNYRRVYNRISTPDSEEFGQVSLISAAGLFLVGTLGVIIFFIMGLIPF